MGTRKLPPRLPFATSIHAALRAYCCDTIRHPPDLSADAEPEELPSDLLVELEPAAHG